MYQQGRTWTCENCGYSSYRVARRRPPCSCRGCRARARRRPAPAIACGSLVFQHQLLEPGVVQDAVDAVGRQQQQLAAGQRAAPRRARRFAAARRRRWSARCASDDAAAAAGRPSGSSRQHCRHPGIVVASPGAAAAAQHIQPAVADVGDRQACRRDAGGDDGRRPSRHVIRGRSPLRGSGRWRGGRRCAAGCRLGQTSGS